MSSLSCPLCVKIIVDLGFDLSEAMTQSSKTRTCDRCGKGWTLTREDEPKIPCAPPLPRKMPGILGCCSGVGKHKGWCSLA